jgi:sulfoxide reductase heme-binding subunit YedZ
MVEQAANNRKHGNPGRRERTPARKRKRFVSKSLVWMLCLLPLARLIWKGFHGGLGANPIEFITLSTGTWTLVLLLATLSISPLRKLTRQSWLIKYRRLIGLFAFFYALLHFICYIWLDKFFDFPEMARDVVKRPFITAGFLAFVLLIPLAVTSTAGFIRRLGGRNWQLLHRLIYVSAASAVIHFWWKVKADTRTPAIYATILAVLLGYRVIAYLIVRSRNTSLRKTHASQEFVHLDPLQKVVCMPSDDGERYKNATE